VKHSHRAYDVVKRLGDVLASLVLLVVLSPLIFVTALAVRAKLGAPVLFRQQRPGVEGRVFTLYKFRTMTAADAGDDLEATGTDAARLTPLGRLLRASSLDELPELWNVLRGDMSMVGPRPWLVEYLPRYTREQARRHEVRPGITGWAQVHGRNELDWDERILMDVWYVDNRSLLLDLRILLMTFATVLSARGVSAPGHATMDPFVGAEGDRRDL
jgi:lipopolysaccharide/colanic/teichoic acid biosynthesis glycosyltransferase